MGSPPLPTVQRWLDRRTAFLPERREMMQEWADYLDRLRAGEAREASSTKL